MRHPTLSTALLLLAVLWVRPAEGKLPVAILLFGGEDGPAARATLVNTLSRRYEIVDGQAVLDVCDELGITMTRGRNLARAAARAGVVAVVGGAVSGGYLSLAIYSGKTGDVVSSGRVRTRGRLSAKGLRAALTVILKGLRQCPTRAPKRRRPPPAPALDPTPAPAPAPAPAPTGKAPALVFDPDPVIDSEGGGTGTAAAGQPQLGGAEEDPLSGVKGPNISTAAGSPGQASAASATVTKKPSADGTPRVEATLGLGIWKRSLQINDHDKRSGAEPKYDSGTALALAVGFRARPIAFFTDGFAANFYSRLNFQTMLGLESRNTTKDASGAEVIETHGTKLWELRWELLGYDWNVLSKPTSPHVEGGIGFGLMEFAIDWGESLQRPMPASSYKYFLISLGANMPFHSMVGGHFRFDYRVVSGTGEIEEDVWYGASSTGGLNLLVGLDGHYKGFIIRAEYEYTRYFYAFKEAADRVEACTSAATCQRAAGGALDQLHGLMVNVGYSY